MFQKELYRLIEINQDAHISRIEAYPLHIQEKQCNYFFCGATVDIRGHIIGIPNMYPQILDIVPETGNIEQWGQVWCGNRKGWTGGGLARDGYIYCFPRGANSILRLDTRSHEIEHIELFKEYESIHHYGGAISNENIIYQPPDNSNKILKYDIEKEKSEEITINSLWKKKFLFYGAINDLCNNTFFFPAGKYCRVCMVDNCGRVKMIGKIFRNAFFNSGTLSPNGDIYGFASYSKGIIHINTSELKTEIIESDFAGGCFGAKLGFNGKIYSIPGNSDVITEFDPQINKVTNCIPLPNVERGRKAKCAGGAIDKEGNIWCVPAMGHFVYKICFEGIRQKPSEELYSSKYFRSFY